MSIYADPGKLIFARIVLLWWGWIENVFVSEGVEGRGEKSKIQCHLITFIYLLIFKIILKILNYN